MKLASLFVLILAALFAAEAVDVEVVDLVIKELSGNTDPRGVHGDLIHLSFSAYGIKFQHELFVDHSVFAEGAEAKFYTGDGELVASRPFRSLTYNTRGGVEPRVSAVVSSFEDIEAVIVDNHRDEVFSLKTDTLEDGTYTHTLSKASDSEEDHPYHDEITALLKAAPQQAESRRLVEGDPNDPRHTGLDVWDNCYTGQADTAKTLTVGIVADYGYYNEYGDMAKILAGITKLVSFSNLIYGQQMNIYMQIGPTDIKTTAGGPGWNQAPRNGRCAKGISGVLDSLTQWRNQNNKNDAGIYHLLTACYPAPGTVGLAYLGVLCNQQVNTGVTSVLKRGQPDQGTWMIFAHEVGHNFGAEHSFERGQGTTGGIMDYGDGLHKGKFQFNTQFRRQPVCNHVRGAIRLGNRGTAVCFKNGQPTGTGGTGTGGGGTNTGNNGGTTITSSPTPQPVLTTYEWEATDFMGCSVVCGGGQRFKKVVCMQIKGTQKREVNDVLCDLAEKAQLESSTEDCNTMACTPALCQTCTDYNCCSEGCTHNCAPEANRRDAGFKIARGVHTYMLRGEDVARYTGKSEAIDAGWPKKIKNAFAKLTENFQSDIDAAFAREDGDIFLFKGDEYVRLSISSGMHNGFPRKIAAGFPGLPTEFQSDLTAAISWSGFASFYKKNKFVAYDYQTNKLFLDVTTTGQDGRVKFLDTIDAIVHDWEFGIKIYRNGKVVSGTAGEAYSAARDTSLIGEASTTQITCPANCDDCGNDPTMCITCAEDFRPSTSTPGACTPKLYAIDLPFNNYQQTTGLMLEHNIAEGSFEEDGNAGKAITWTKDTFGVIKPKDDRFANFETHAWVKLENTNPGALMSIEFDNGFKGQWEVITRSSVQVLRFSLGDSEVGIFQVTGTKPLIVGEWAHIHADFVNGNLRVSVDAEENRIALPEHAAEKLMSTENGTKKNMRISKMRLGKTEDGQDGLDAILDGFHIDYEPEGNNQDPKEPDTGTISGETSDGEAEDKEISETSGATSNLVSGLLLLLAYFLV